MLRPLCAVVFVFGGLVDPVAARAAEPAAKWEARALAALADGDRKALRSLADEFGRLSPEARRDLSLRVREDSVEFAFRGEFPADDSPWNLLEYLVSGPANAYESLLVASAAERKRVRALGPFFRKYAGEGRGKWWSARLVWTEGGTPQSADLADMLLPVKAADRERFRDGIAVNDAGLGGSMNVQADPASLPRKRVSALLLLTLRIAPEK
jgi:hypothetical protein